MSSEDPTIQAIQRDIKALEDREQYLRDEQAKEKRGTDRSAFGYAAAFCNFAKWRADCYGEMGDRYEALGDDDRANEATTKALSLQETEVKLREAEKEAARQRLAARAELAEVGSGR